MNPANITIGVLDRDPADLAHLASILEDGGYRVLPASTQAQIEQYATTEALNLVVKGFEVGHVDAVGFMSRVRAISPDTEFILCGRGGTIADAVDAIHQGACDYLGKPVHDASLHEAVRKALERQELIA